MHRGNFEKYSCRQQNKVADCALSDTCDLLTKNELNQEMIRSPKPVQRIIEISTL